LAADESNPCSTAEFRTKISNFMKQTVAKWVKCVIYCRSLLPLNFTETDVMDKT
jgi:hypothetical protein